MRALWGHQSSCAGPLHRNRHRQVATAHDWTDGSDDESGGLLSDEDDDDTRSIIDGEDSASDCCGEHASAHTSIRRRRCAQKAAFEGLTRLRLDYNASNAQVDAVKDMMQEVFGCMMEKLAKRLHRAQSRGESLPLAQHDIAALLSKVSDPFVGMRSSYLEGKLRAARLPNLQPIARVLGYRTITHKHEDGSTSQERRTDYVYDFDIKRQLESMFKFNPMTCKDFLESMDRWKVSAHFSPLHP